MSFHADRMSLASRTLLRCKRWSCALACALCLSVGSFVWADGEVEPGRSHEPTVGLALPPRANGREARMDARTHSTSNGAGLWTTVIALGSIVGVLTLVGRWIKPYVGVPRGLPIEAFELLGRRQLEPKVAVHLVRCGGRVLVLGVSTDGVRTLSEINDPGEVERLTETCLNPREGRRPPVSARSSLPRESVATSQSVRAREPRLATFDRGEETTHE